MLLIAIALIAIIALIAPAGGWRDDSMLKTLASLEDTGSVSSTHIVRTQTPGHPLLSSIPCRHTYLTFIYINLQAG